MKRLKQRLVESFVATIAIGWVFAQAIIHFVYVFATPLAVWLARSRFVMPNEAGVKPASFSVEDGVPDLVKCLLLLLVGYFLLRWLYLNSTERESGSTKLTSETPD